MKREVEPIAPCAATIAAGQIKVQGDPEQIAAHRHGELSRSPEKCCQELLEDGVVQFAGRRRFEPRGFSESGECPLVLAMGMLGGLLHNVEIEGCEWSVVVIRVADGTEFAK